MASSQKGPTARALILGVFLVFFGLAIGILTPLTLIGPLLGLLLVGFGVYIIWTSARHGEPPEPLS